MVILALCLVLVTAPASTSAQNSEDIDTVTGATSSGGNFVKLTALLLEKAKTGDKTLSVVQSESE